MTDQNPPRILPGPQSLIIGPCGRIGFRAIGQTGLEPTAPEPVYSPTDLGQGIQFGLTGSQRLQLEIHKTTDIGLDIRLAMTEKPEFGYFYRLIAHTGTYPRLRFRPYRHSQ